MAVPATPPTARQRRRIPAVVHKPGDGRMELDREAIKDGLFIVGLPLLAIVAAFWFTAKYIKPATPDRFVMTTGPEGGAYQLFAREYQKILARDKVTIVLKPSAGSVENLQQLQTPKSDVEAALAQAGIITGEPPSGLRSLGAMYYEPLWIFYRGKEDIDRLTQFAGKRVAIGPEGSGTRALALQLLKAGGALTAATELLPLGSNDAVNALIDGHADAALLVASSDAPTVLTLATAKDIKIVSLVQAEAFARRFPFLTVLHLPRGTVDLAFFGANLAKLFHGGWFPIGIALVVLIIVALPGIDADQVETVIEDSSLRVSGRREHPPELRTAVIHRLELPQGRFERRIPLPPGRYAAVRRSTANGCLLVSLHKTA
jgi:TRAP transporter TAXI family solute receptor